jgi:hypothetical protein
MYLLELPLSGPCVPSSTTTCHFLSQPVKTLFGWDLRATLASLYGKIIVGTGGVVVDTPEYDLAVAELATHKYSLGIELFEAAFLVYLRPTIRPSVCSNHACRQNGDRSHHLFDMNHCGCRRQRPEYCGVSRCLG